MLILKPSLVFIIIWYTVLPYSVSLVVGLWVLSLPNHRALQLGEAEGSKSDCSCPVPPQTCMVGNHQKIACGKEQSEAPDSQSWLGGREDVPGPSERLGLWSSQAPEDPVVKELRTEWGATTWF